MKTFIVIFFLFIAYQNSYAQIEVKDSIFIRKLSSETNKFNYHISDKGQIIGLNFHKKNKYDDFLGFIAGYKDLFLTLKNKRSIPKDKLINYNEFNDLLGNNFMQYYYYYKIYFIISEDENDYLVLPVRPILPPELNKQ